MLGRVLLALLAEIILCACWNRFDDWTLEEMPLRFVVTAVLAGATFLAALAWFPSGLSRRTQLLLFWGGAIALRLVVLPLEPGDDFWRYIWEGKIQQAGFNPYLHAPDDPALAELRAAFPDWEKINHRDFSAIYPPGTELMFRALNSFSNAPIVYKLFFTIADLAIAALLMRLMAPAQAAWYAWNPLVVYSFAGSGHFDSLMILPMLGGIICLTRFEAATAEKQRWLFALAAAALFGIAISIKLIPILLLPLCVFALRTHAPALLVSLALPTALALAYGWPHVPIWESLRAFANVTRVNDLFWWLSEQTIWANPRQKNYHYNRVILIAVIALSLVFWRNWRRGMLWVMGTALILSPVLHPWYCTWILPLAAWRRVEPWLILSVSIFAYFLFWNERLFFLPWHSEWWLRALIMIPPLVGTIFYFTRSAAKPATADA